jgi:hypothetical protein
LESWGPRVEATLGSNLRTVSAYLSRVLITDERFF